MVVVVVVALVVVAVVVVVDVATAAVERCPGDVERVTRAALPKTGAATTLFSTSVYANAVASSDVLETTKFTTARMSHDRPYLSPGAGYRLPFDRP